ncbi:MED6-domain-containing protein [Abortiporus biennis]|nr:MED6-domain-containing protein [Abortiporus biennis]
MDDLHPPDDYSHRFFIWHEWIQANGPLTNKNVFDYFATSMFYDKQSNNQVLRMQTMHTGLPLVNEAEELRRFTGIEFALVHSQPPSLFIIHKRDRVSPDEVRPLAAYFIMNNRIYQSPDVYTLISNRLLTSLHSLQTSLSTLNQHKPAYTPRTGFVWPIVEAASSEETKKRELPEEATATSDAPGTLGASSTTKRPTAKKRVNNLLLLNAMRTTAIHANQSFTLPIAASESADETASVDRTSPTPAPTSQKPGTPKAISNAPTPQDLSSVKTSSGLGKKKKKRTATLPPTG